MKSTRLTLALAGPANAGKSTLLNLVAGQSVAITSPIPGTTTDVVEKAIELPPFGPTLWLDTAGWADSTPLAHLRAQRTQAALTRADIIIAVIPATLTLPDPELTALQQSGKPLLTLITHTDQASPAPLLKALPHALTLNPETSRNTFLKAFKTALTPLIPAEFIRPPELLPPLPPGATLLHIIPIDSQAPKGRIILPQMNALRNALDRDFISIAITEKRIKEALSAMTRPPDLALCDSQVVHRMIAELPPNLPCTTYSILMARLKGDLPSLARGAQAIETLQEGSRILIAEACTHHAAEEDIGRVKIPALLRKATGKNLIFDVTSGRDFPPDLTPYSLIIHCGGCMINRTLMLWRQQQAAEAGIPITNYGIAIAAAQGYLNRVLQPFGL